MVPRVVGVLFQYRTPPSLMLTSLVLPLHQSFLLCLSHSALWHIILGSFDVFPFLLQPEGKTFPGGSERSVLLLTAMATMGTTSIHLERRGDILGGCMRFSGLLCQGWELVGVEVEGGDSSIMCSLTENSCRSQANSHYLNWWTPIEISAIWSWPSWAKRKRKGKRN